MRGYFIVVDVPDNELGEDRAVVGPFPDLRAAYAHRYRHFADRRAVVVNRIVPPIPDNDD